MKKFLLQTLFTTLLCFAASAHAGFIDVTEIVDNTLNVQNLSNVTLTSSGVDGFFVGSGGFCAFAPDFSCEEDFQIDFLSSVENLFLSSFGVTPGGSDSVKISAFLGASFLGDLTVVTNGTFDLSGFGVLDRLFFDDTSTSAGIGWNNFEFDTLSVPEPATLALLGMGLAGIGLARRRKKV